MLKELKRRYQANALTKSEYIDRMHAQHQSLFEYAAFLSGSGIEKIEISADQVIMTVASSGIKLAASDTDKRIIPIEILNFGAHETAEWKMMSALLPASPVVLDIGANVGWYAIHVARFYRGAEVHAFEPVPWTYAQFMDNLFLNDIDTVQANNFGLWEKVNEMDIYFDPTLSGAASARDILETSPPPTRCRFTTIDTYRKSLNRPVDFIKCDVEGGELHVLRGGIRTLREDKPVVFAELLRKWAKKFDYHPQDVVTLLNAHGYECYEIVENRLSKRTRIDNAAETTNFFFLHDAAHGAFIDKLTSRKER
jgi:FkbM family methyltransferase